MHFHTQMRCLHQLSANVLRAYGERQFESEWFLYVTLIGRRVSGPVLTDEPSYRKSVLNVSSEKNYLTLKRAPIKLRSTAQIGPDFRTNESINANR